MEIPTSFLALSVKMFRLPRPAVFQRPYVARYFSFSDVPGPRRNVPRYFHRSAGRPTSQISERATFHSAPQNLAGVRDSIAGIAVRVTLLCDICVLRFANARLTLWAWTWRANQTMSFPWSKKQAIAWPLSILTFLLLLWHLYRGEALTVTANAFFEPFLHSGENLQMQSMNINRNIQKMGLQNALNGLWQTWL